MKKFIIFLMYLNTLYAYTIDEFDYPVNESHTVKNNTSITWYNTGTEDNFIGGNRDCRLARRNPTTNRAGVRATTRNGVLSIRSKNASPDFRLIYDGTAGWNNNGSFPPKDISNGGINDKISFLFTYANQNPNFSRFEIYVRQNSTIYSYDAYNEITTWFNYNISDLQNSIPRQFEIPFSYFNSNLDSVTGIAFFMISEAIDSEYKIDWIRATPEPHTIILRLVTLTLGIIVRNKLFKTL